MLAWSTTRETLIEAFSEFGEVLDAAVVMDKMQVGMYVCMCVCVFNVCVCV